MNGATTLTDVWDTAQRAVFFMMRTRTDDASRFPR